MLKADFHMHTSYSPDSEMSPEALVARCLKVGLNCVAVTDHNTIEGALIVRDIAPFTVIIGEEIASAEGEITGLFLKEAIPKGLSPIDTVKLIKDQGGIVSIPHPFDRFRGSVISKKALDEILPYSDIVEVFNSRNNLKADDRKALHFAELHGLLASGVSDAHTPFELGRTYVSMPDFNGTPVSFMESLAQGKIVGKRSTFLVHVLTTFVKSKKKLNSWIRKEI